MNFKISDAFVELGIYLAENDSELQAQINGLSNYNPWFTLENVQLSVNAWANLLSKEKLDKWMEDNKVQSPQDSKKIGLILAGNIPIVGFHDILSVLISGHEAHIKLSSQDQHLIPFLLNKLIAIAPSLATKIFYPDRLVNIDAVIATGSNNSARYFEYYFGAIPHIIRKNRNSIAVLTETTSTEELKALGKDVFSYFGLGCRNVSKIFIPRNFSLVNLLDNFQSFEAISNFHKYHNNYDYQKSILLVNGENHLDNGFLLLRELESLQAAISVLHYEYYDSIQDLELRLESQKENIQCIASNIPLKSSNQKVAIGETQFPALDDYADGINTLEFLKK